MLAKAATLCGKDTIQVRELELPPIRDDEPLVKNISNSICLLTYKATLLGEDHKHVPDNISKHSPITGHEFTGIIMGVENHLKGRFQLGEKFVLQPATGLPSGYPAGCSYEYFGGNATYCITPKITTDLGCVLPYRGDYFVNAFLNEPTSCIIGTHHTVHHTKQYVYEHLMDVKGQGRLVLVGCAGLAGIGMIDYAVNGPVSSKLTVVTGTDERRLEYVHTLIPEEAAERRRRILICISTKDIDAVSKLRRLSRGTSFDDVFILVTVPALLKQADVVLGSDGCLNFFTGPTNERFAVPFNFYNVHYERTHIMGTSGGSTQDMLECPTLSAESRLNPGYMATHTGGLRAISETTLNLSNIPGGGKLIYPHIDLFLATIEDLHSRRSGNPLLKTLADAYERNHNVQCEEAETYLLEYYQV